MKNELKNGNLDLTIYKRLEWKILTEEFWFYLSVKWTVTQMVRGGGKAVTGGYSGVVAKNPVLVPPVLLCW